MNFETLLNTEKYKNFLQEIKDKESTLAGNIWKRYDVDRDIVLKPHKWELPDENGVMQEVSGASHITLNLAKVYLFKVNAIMTSSERTIQVKGRNKSGQPLSDTATGTIADFCERILKMADKRLTMTGQWPLKPWIVEQLNWRGAVDIRCYLTIAKDNKGNPILKDGKAQLKVNISPRDVRFVSYEFNSDGLEWEGYQMRRTKDQVKREYGHNCKNDVIVRDSWKGKENIIFVDDEAVKVKGNPYSKVPIILKFCQSGNMLQDYDEYVWQARGESVFASDRYLYPVANDTASMLQSMSVRSYKPALLYKSPDGTVLPDKSPWRPGSVTPVAEGEGIDKVPSDDIKLATQLMQKWLISCIELGSVSSADMGELSFPQSSIVVQQMINQRNQILIPRLTTLSETYSELLHMAIEQYIQLGQEMGVGEIGDMKEFKPEDLAGDYDIIVKHHAVYPEQNIAELSLANAQLGFFPRRWIMENTFHQKDPDNPIREKDIENAEGSIPAFAYAKLARQLMKESIDEHDPEKEAYAKLLAKMANSTLKKLASGDFDPNKLNAPRSPVQNDNLTALIAGQNTGTSTTTAKQATTNQTRQESVSTGANR